MTGVGMRRAVVALVLAAGTATASTGCSAGTVKPVTTAAWVEGGLPDYCAGYDGDDAGFWKLVHASCEVAQDGDVEQASALHSLLDQLETPEVVAFDHTMRRLNRALRGAADVADALCAPGLGLGQDLGTDYRSWVIAHGQSVYEAVLDDPDRLRDLPDARVGCGLGEPFGAAASLLHLERTGKILPSPHG
jgi:hypothetical protein